MAISVKFLHAVILPVGDVDRPLGINGDSQGCGIVLATAVAPELDITLPCLLNT
jgi:hypothetical protein